MLAFGLFTQVSDSGPRGPLVFCSWGGGGGGGGEEKGISNRKKFNRYSLIVSAHVLYKFSSSCLKWFSSF